jgi:hypothetical protein
VTLDEQTQEQLRALGYAVDPEGGGKPFRPVL